MKYIFISLLSLSLCTKAQVRDFVSTPKVKWKFAITSPIFSSPVVSNGVVYFGGLDSTFYALELSSGKIKMKLKTHGTIRSTAVVEENTLYLNGGDGNLYALDKNTFKIRWTFNGKGEKKYDFADYHHATPVIYRNTIYFGCGDGNLYAVNKQNGSEVWHFQTNGIVHSTPAIDNDKIFFGSFDGNVYALQLETGAMLWKFKTVGQMYFPKGEVQGSPAVYKGAVVVGARDYNVYAISQQHGTGLWNKAFPRGWGLVNTIKDSILYIGTGDERKFFSVNPENGREYWKRDMELLVFGSSAFSPAMIYTGSTMGKLHGIDKITGKDKWIFETDNYRKNRLKFFKEDDSNRDDIYSIIKTNEAFLEAQYELEGIFSTPAITDDYILITTTGGTVYCLER
jgi:outer membrane protein assembly factor BamB